MNGLEKLVELGVRANCPYTHFVNEHAVKGIVKGLIRNGGVCPCSHREWTIGNTPVEDTYCPCVTFRTTGECHCTLYLPSTKPDRE